MLENDCPPKILPNPFTPLVFAISPDVAHQVEIGRYIPVGGLSILIWDILSNITSDYQLLFKSKHGFPTGIYFLSRLVNLAFVLMFTIFQTLPVGDCYLFNQLGH
ncbi:hypothetical protein C8J56DRAFT_965086 [Mycena floridula]|nr:hypothetical protein C8J56DRAFT_965086 [Mycena floridula]